LCPLYRTSTASNTGVALSSRRGRGRLRDRCQSSNRADSGVCNASIFTSTSWRQPPHSWRARHPLNRLLPGPHRPAQPYRGSRSPALRSSHLAVRASTRRWLTSWIARSSMSHTICSGFGPAHRAGEATIHGMLNYVRSPPIEVVVVPQGTYRLTVGVTDADAPQEKISGALVRKSSTALSRCWSTSARGLRAPSRAVPPR
jgi:hypothetical protein